MNTDTGAATPQSLDVLRVLKAARARVAKGWTQGCSARDAAGNYVDCAIRPDTAVAWCAMGALHWSDADGCTACAAFQQALGDEDPVDWNDEQGRTQAEVLAAFDKAIGIAQGNAPKAPSKEIL